MENKKSKAYLSLFVMALLHLPLMYVIMFTMIDTLNDFKNNLNTFYMAVMMVAPMLLMMPLSMKEMYKDKKMNLVVYVLSVLLFIGAYAGIRRQSFINDKQFILSMIPHHSGAILMCREASLTDSELSKLCTEIEQAQRREINQMNEIYERLNK